jgi:hypothetical protein
VHIASLAATSLKIEPPPSCSYGTGRKYREPCHLINGAPKILQSTTNLDEYLAEMPGVAEFSTSSTNAFGPVAT